MNRWQHQEYWLPSQTGVNSAALNVTTNSNWIGCNGASQLTLDIDIVNATGAALPIVFYIETRQGKDATSVQRYLCKELDAVPAAGVVISDVYPNQKRYTTPAVAATYRLSYEIGNTADEIRLVGITAAGAGATDLISIGVKVSY